MPIRYFYCHIFLDPKYVLLVNCGLVLTQMTWISLGNCDASILKNINPLAIPTIHINHSAFDGQPSASTQASASKTLTRIGNVLISQLCVEYEEKHEKIFDLDIRVAVPRLKEQFVAYARGTWPFNQTFTTDSDIIIYWSDFLNHDHADILVVCGLTRLGTSRD